MDAFLHLLENFLQQIRWWPIAALGLSCCILTLFFCTLDLPEQQSPAPPDTDPPFSIKTIHADTSAVPSAPAPPSRAIRAYDPETKKIISLDLETYIQGVVAAEMYASYEPEALKAQAVAARTYLLQKILSGAGCSRHENADICLDSGHCQAYLSLAERQARWGASFQTYETKIQNAVQETAGLCVLYDGEPIHAYYHAVSGGQTENVVSVFQMNLPYLQSVQSPGEENSSHYEETKEISRKTVVKKLKTYASLSTSKLESQIKILSRSDSGRVLTLRVGNETITGRDFRMALGLDSTNFSIRYTTDSLKITTRGYGHGVGLSQAGAQAMALSGATFDQILTHYYTGVTIAPFTVPES